MRGRVGLGMAGWMGRLSDIRVSCLLLEGPKGPKWYEKETWGDWGFVHGRGMDGWIGICVIDS